MVDSFKNFNKKRLTEQEDEEPINRLFGTGDNPKRDLIQLLLDLIDMISKSNPEDQESYDEIKARIQDSKDAIISHKDFREFKEEGFEWQDTQLGLSEWEHDLKKAVKSLYYKATKKGLS